MPSGLGRVNRPSEVETGVVGDCSLELFRGGICAGPGPGTLVAGPLTLVLVLEYDPTNGWCFCEANGSNKLSVEAAADTQVTQDKSADARNGLAIVL